MHSKIVTNSTRLSVCLLLLLSVSTSHQDPLSRPNRPSSNVKLQFSAHKSATLPESVLPGNLEKDNDPQEGNQLPYTNFYQDLDEDADADLLTSGPSAQSVPADQKGHEMDKLIYELVQDEQKEAIRDQFENTALKAVALKSKLDSKIDETIMALQNLKNLRRHIVSAHAFASRLVNSKVTNDQIKRYVVTQLGNSVQQVEQTLSQTAAPNPQS